MAVSRREASWLAHLELLAGLPYPAPALMPTVLAAVRSGFDADFGTFGWVEGGHLKPAAFWSERMTEPVFRWFADHMDELFAEFPLRQQLESDGEIVRVIQSMPGYEEHWHYRQILAPLGVRWAMVVPVFDGEGGCDGFLYLYRRAEAGPFTDADQARLRRARDCLRALNRPAIDGTPCPQRPAGTAVLSVDGAGRVFARSQRAIELLYLCHDAQMGVLEWAAAGLTALPEEARAMVRRLLASEDDSEIGRCGVNRAAGRFEFRAERLRVLEGGLSQVAVTITHLEPIDITVARQLLHWPLSPQEKRLLVASARQPSQQQLAAALGVTIPTLKSYINRLQARMNVSSRQQLIDRLLDEAAT